MNFRDGSGIVCAMAKITTVEVYKAKDGWRWRAKARNGRVIAVGEAYTRSHSAARGARRANPGARVCRAKG